MQESPLFAPNLSANTRFTPVLPFPVRVLKGLFSRMILPLVSRRIGALSIVTALSFSLSAPAFSAPPTYDADAIVPAPSTFAITNARIVTGTGKTLARGTVIIRNGLIEKIGESADVPKDATVIDGAGLTVYPALVDAFTNAGMPLAADYPKEVRGATYPVGTIRADIQTATLFQPDDVAGASRRKNGFGAALVAPGVGLIAGTSAFVSLAPEKPDTAALLLKSNVAMHGSWDNPAPTGVTGYPRSLMGEISAIRQALYDAMDAEMRGNEYAKNPGGRSRPVVADPVVALIPVAKRQLPFVLHADSAIEIRRVLRIAKEFGIAPIIEGGTEAGAVAGELKAAGASVLLSASLPEPPKVAAGGTDESSLQTLRYRANVRRTAAKLSAAGVPFALGTNGLKSVDEYRTNVRKMIAAGLPADAATFAATGAAAKLFGADKQIGSLAPGMVGNVLITDGDLWAAKTKVRYLFVDGIQTDAGEGAKLGAPVAEGTVAATDADYAEAQYAEALKSLPPGVTAEQAIEFLKTSPDQAKQFLPAGQTAEQALAALEKRAVNPEKSAGTGAAKPAVDTVTAPPATGTGMVPPLPPQLPASFVLRGATVWTVAKDGTLPKADVYVKNGKIAGVGANLSVPGGTTEIDATGKHVSPGMIDCHSHTALDAVNEGTNSVTAECRIGDVINPEDVNIYRQLAGGTTCANLLHGSANSIGGQNQIVKWRWGMDAEGLMFAQAPPGIKFALGENVTQSNREPTTLRYPYSRMGVEKTIRQAFTLARDYREARQGNKVGRDLRMDALVEILDGKRNVHCHSYRQDEILMMIRVADEFGFKIGTFQHVMEGYKVADEIAKHGAGASTFSDWWGYKFEVRDANPYNGALMAERGTLVSFNSDDSELARRLNLEAAKAIHWGGMKPEEAIKFVTINPAKQLGIDKYVGSIETGKDADLVVWSGDPISTNTICEKTFVDGTLRFDRAADLAARPALDAEKKRLLAAEAPKKAVAKKEEAVTKAPASAPAKPGQIAERMNNSALPVSGKVTAIVGATIHPVSGADIPNGVVVMQSGKIVAVGAKSAVTVPAGAEVSDATGLHVYPGLFNADTTMGLTEINSLRETVDSREIGTFSPELRSVVAVNPDTDLLPAARANGVLTVVSAPEGGIISGQGALLSLNGWTWEDLAIDQSVGMYVSFPRTGTGRRREESHADLCEDMSGTEPPAIGAALFAQVAPTPATDTLKPDERREKALKPLNDFLDAARRYQKAKATGTLQHPDVKWEAMLPVLSGATPLYIRADREEDIRAAVAWAKGNGFPIVLVGGRESDRCADLLARENVPVILGEVLSLPRESDAPYDDAFTIPAKLAKAGVRFALTAGETSASQRLPWQAAMAAAFGLDKNAALRAITLTPAQITGHSSHLGSIEIGKDATLIVTTGSPLEITSVVKAAYIRGEPVSIETRQKALYEKYQSRPRK